MSLLEPLAKLRSRRESHGERYALDSLLALGSILLLTTLIWFFRLYQRIPDSFLIYLLAILLLASVRGLYTALLASFVAFFSFDFFFVPPLYDLSVTKFEDVLTLVVFLVTAVITSQLASALAQRAEDASRRERETAILYELVRATNREEDLELQLSAFARAVVEVFSPWGVRDCLLLLPDEQGTPVPFVSACHAVEEIALSCDEQAIAERVFAQGCTVDLPDGEYADSCAGAAREAKMQRYVRMIPLETEGVIGVLRLLIEHQASDEISLGREQVHASPEAVFFSTFLEQAVAVIEREKLRQESVHMKVLQQTEALRSALLSSVSHDLRTPLSTIKTSATSLLDEDTQWDAETRYSFTAAIEREADRLNRLVENLLGMSRIEAGLLQLEKEWYPLDELVRTVLTRMQPVLEGRIIQTQFPNQLPPLQLDSVMIDQVVTNLLENVSRYTPCGTPLDVSIQEQEKEVVVSIADRGPGIAPLERERIFDKFYRVRTKEPISGTARGCGLGLAICRGLVEAHGGRIWVEEREGGGAVFQFTLPLSRTGALEL